MPEAVASHVQGVGRVERLGGREHLLVEEGVDEQEAHRRLGDLEATVAEPDQGHVDLGDGEVLEPLLDRLGAAEDEHVHRVGRARRRGQGIAEPDIADRGRQRLERSEMGQVDGAPQDGRDELRGAR